MTTVFDRLGRHRIVPVVTADTAEQGLHVARALADGGLPVAEVTFRTPAAAEAIATIRGATDVLVGAGTVVRAEQVDEAVSAGAAFVVSPGLSLAVVERARHHGVPVLPGAVTATEIQAALEAGIGLVKFFPAETSGGAAAIRALEAPFGDVRFVPTGGISLKNLRMYLSRPSVLAVGGSWMLPADALAAGDWPRVRALTAETVAAVTHEARR